MKNRDTNRVNMISTTHQFCTDNGAVLAPIPAAPSVVSTIGTKLSLINALDQLASATTIGVTLDTNAIRKTMETIAFKCASATFAYASSANNNTLKAQVNFTIPKLEAKHKEEVDDICQTIHDASNTYFGGAEQYGIVATDVSDLQTAINLYRTASQNPRQAIITKSSAKSQIVALIKELSDIILKEQLDNIVNTLIITNPIFVNQYFQAREIIDLGTTHTKLRGTVSDNNDNPLANADVFLFATGQRVPLLQTKTDVEGKFSITPVTPNTDYDLEVTFPQFQTFFEANIHFSPGEEVNRDVTLQPV